MMASQKGAKHPSSVSYLKDLDLFWVDEPHTSNLQKTAFDTAVWSWDPREEGLGVFEYVLPIATNPVNTSKILKLDIFNNDDHYKPSSIHMLDDDVSSLTSSVSEKFLDYGLSPLSENHDTVLEDVKPLESDTVPTSAAAEASMPLKNTSETAYASASVNLHSSTAVSHEGSINFCTTRPQTALYASETAPFSMFNHWPFNESKDVPLTEDGVRNGVASASAVAEGRPSVPPNKSVMAAAANKENTDNAYPSDHGYASNGPICPPNANQNGAMYQVHTQVTDAALIAPYTIYKRSVYPMGDAAASSSERYVYTGLFNPMRDTDQTEIVFSRVSDVVQQPVASADTAKDIPEPSTPPASVVPPSSQLRVPFGSEDLSLPTPYHYEEGSPLWDSSDTTPSFFFSREGEANEWISSPKMHSNAGISPSRAYLSLADLDSVSLEKRGLFRLACGCIVPHRSVDVASSQCQLCGEYSPRKWEKGSLDTSLQVEADSSHLSPTRLHRKRRCSVYLEKETKRFGDSLRRNGRLSFGSDQETYKSLLKGLNDSSTISQAILDAQGKKEELWLTPETHPKKTFLLETLSDGELETYASKWHRAMDRDKAFSSHLEERKQTPTPMAPGEDASIERDTHTKRNRTLSNWIKAPMGLSPLAHEPFRLSFDTENTHMFVNGVSRLPLNSETPMDSAYTTPRRTHWPSVHTPIRQNHGGQVKNKPWAYEKYNQQIVELLVEFYNEKCYRIITAEDPTFPEVYIKAKAICDKYFKDRGDFDKHRYDRNEKGEEKQWCTSEVRSAVFKKLLDYNFGELYPIGVEYRSPSNASELPISLDPKWAVMDRANWGRSSEYYRDSAGIASVISYTGDVKPLTNAYPLNHSSGVSYLNSMDAIKERVNAPLLQHNEAQFSSEDSPASSHPPLDPLPIETPPLEDLPADIVSLEDPPLNPSLPLNNHIESHPTSPTYDLVPMDSSINERSTMQVVQEDIVSTPVATSYPSGHAMALERTAALSVSHACQTEIGALEYEALWVKPSTSHRRVSSKRAVTLKASRNNNVKTELTTTHMALSPLRQQERRYPQRNRCRPLKWYIGERQEYQMNAELGVAEVVAISECLNADKVLQHLIGAYNPKRKLVKKIKLEKRMLTNVSKGNDNSPKDGLGSRMYPFFLGRKPKYALSSQVRNQDGTFFRYKSVYERNKLDWNRVASGAAKQTEIMVALNARTSQVKACNIRIPSGHHKETDSTRDHIFYGYVLRGEDLLVTIGGQNVHTKEGDAFVIPQFTDWSLQNVSRDRQDAEIWLNLVTL